MAIILPKTLIIIQTSVIITTEAIKPGCGRTDRLAYWDTQNAMLDAGLRGGTNLVQPIELSWRG